MFIFELCVDFLFFCDICITLNTAYYNEGKLVVERKHILYNYLPIMFIDIISIIPFFLFDDSSTSESNSLIRMIRILKITKILRASRLGKITHNIFNSDKLEKYVAIFRKYNGVSRLIGGLFIILIIAHSTACVWYLIARIENFAYDTWVVRHGFIDENNGKKYLAGLYWAFTILTTVGFGDITARTST